MTLSGRGEVAGVEWREGIDGRRNVSSVKVGDSIRPDVDGGGGGMPVPMSGRGDQGVSMDSGPGELCTLRRIRRLPSWTCHLSWREDVRETEPAYADRGDVRRVHYRG